MNKVTSIDGTGAAEVPNRRQSRSLRRELVRVGSLVVLALLVLAGMIFYLLSGRYVTTDNAFVQANKAYLSAQVEGRAVEVLVRANQSVKAGDVLFRIDDAPYRIALERAEADVAATRYGIDALQASYREKSAALATASENIAFAEKEFQRQQELLGRGVISRVRYDQAEHELTVARQKRNEAQQELAAIAARLGGKSSQDSARSPEVLRAIAAYDQAKLDLSHTVVTAPEDSIVAAVNLQLGEQVQPGKPVISLVSKRSLWITANFKETELTNVTPGQKATITVDIYPDREWHATVGSISPATGAEFSLIPPQNASGNWVKVVQRLPIRLYLDDYTGDPPLPAGLSAYVKIDTGHRSGLQRLFDSVFG